MTIDDLNNNLTNLLQDYILFEQHYITGRMHDSINFICTYDDEYLDIQLESVDYLYFIEQGRFIESFYTLNSVERVMSEFLESQIVMDIERKLLRH